MAAEEEDDYMSDAFLLQAAAAEPRSREADFRWESRERKRERQIEERRAQLAAEQRQFSKRARKERATDALVTALETPLDERNKGFAMLQKLGYSRGSGLGKSGQGRVEPIGIQLSSGRKGLGLENTRRIQARLVEEARERRRLAAEPPPDAAAAKDRVDDQQLATFRSQMRAKFARQRTLRDVDRSRRACEQLDSQKGYPDIGLWPRPDEALEQEQAAAAWPPAPRLGPGADARTAAAPPVADAAAPASETAPVDGTAAVQEADDADVLSDLEPAEQLQVLTSYLREAHLFCLWCGFAYDDEPGLAAGCPGPDAVSHDE